MAAGDYSYHPHTLGSMIAQGYAGAQDSLASSQAVSAARQTAAQQYQQEQSQNQIQRIKEALPLLSLQAQQAAGQKALQIGLGGGGGGAPGTNIANPGQPLTPFIAPNLPKDISPAEDQMVRTVLGEAGGQPLAGQQGVAAVIKNRMDAGNQSAQDVIFAPNQFSSWTDPRTLKNMTTADPASKQYQDILKNVVRPVMSGDAKDPTGGATNFYAPKGMPGGAPPSWAVNQQPTAVIGGHQFYKLPYGGGGAPSPAPVAGAPSVAPPVAGARPVLPPPQPAIAPNAGAQVAGPAAPTSGVIPTLAASPSQVGWSGRLGRQHQDRGQATVAPTTPPVTAQPPGLQDAAAQSHA